MARSYGQITRRGAFLWIDCEPQVAMRLRRLFDGCKRGPRNEVIIRCTDAAAHDLRWFAVRYPLEAAPEVGLEAAADRHQNKLDRIEETFAADYTPPAFDLALPPREYQRVGADYILRTGGTLIADDLGLGKTVTMIAAMRGAGALPAVVVTMTHLCGQWEREIKRFAPDLRVHVVNRGTSYPLSDVFLTEVGPSGRRRVVRGGQRRLPDVIILNYHKLDGWAHDLAALGPGLVVFDEVQELRTGEGSRKGEAAKALANAARYRGGASATPIYNYGGEFWNVMDVIRPGVLGGHDEFIREWCTGGDASKAKVREPEALRAYLLEQGAMLRRRRRDVGRELPPMQRIWVDVETKADPLREVADSVAELARLVLRTNADPFAKMQAAGEMDWRLRQATGLAKAPAVVDFVTMAVKGSGERVVLFGHHHLVFDAWRDGLAARGVRAALYTGRESATQKAASVEAFIAGDAPVLIMSLRAGAGLDGLQHHCATAVMGELDWSPGVHLQDEGRLDRDGQQVPVTAFYLVSSEGSDPAIRDVLGIKEAQRAGIVDGVVSDEAELATADPARMRRLAEAYLAQRGER